MFYKIATVPILQVVTHLFVTLTPLLNDLYSFGIVMWEIWMRDVPFQQFRTIWDIRSAVEQGTRPPIPADMPASYASLMEACWSSVQEHRPTFSEIVARLPAVREDASVD